MQNVLKPPHWIDTPAGLKTMVRSLERQSRLAVDTESNSLHAYREQVCLIQFSTPRIDYLLDPLDLRDLSSLRPLFANPKIEKVFHAVEYDLICLKRDFGVEIVNIFDTMQSARILGYPQVGLDALLGLKFGLEIDKRYQKADWAYRPLTPEMLSYARLDTHYLLRLRDKLQAELQAAGRWELAAEEFVRLSKVNGNNKSDLPSWQRVSRAQKLGGNELAVLKELCEWRDRTAEHLARPAFKVVDDRRLIALALAHPSRSEELKNILTDVQRKRFGAELLHAVRRGLEAPPLSRPRPRARPSRAQLERGNALSQWRKQVGKEYKVDSDIILPKPWMQAITEQNPRNREELAALMPDSPWRLEKFAEAILKVIK
jgi:ribonuclease D